MNALRLLFGYTEVSKGSLGLFWDKVDERKVKL